MSALASEIDVVEMLAYYHVGDKKENPHCHMVISHSTVVQKQSYALRIKKLCPQIVKSGDYALAVWDGNKCMGAVSYMFHEEEAKQLANKGFTEEELILARKANESVQKVIAINKEKANTKLVQLAMEHFKGQYATKYDIFLFMLKRIHSGESYHPGDWKLKSYVEEVKLKITDVEDLENYATGEFRRLFRD